VKPDLSGKPLKADKKVESDSATSSDEEEEVRKKDQKLKDRSPPKPVVEQSKKHKIESSSSKPPKDLIKHQVEKALDEELRDIKKSSKREEVKKQ
jgi:hypothetical protein